MKQRLRTGVIGATLGAALACTTLPAHAAMHALIMTIGIYQDPSGNLPGIDLDAQAARRIVTAMGVPSANITQLKDAQLTYDGLSKAFKDLATRIKEGDQVVLYNSGHGAQVPNVSGSGKKCSEGLVTYDVKVYFDVELEEDLKRLGTKASEVVMLNDSCFSGGASVKALGFREKQFSGAMLKSASGKPLAAAGPAECGEAINKGFLGKSFEVVSRANANVIYIAAAADNEVAYATNSGSVATQAWAACIADPAADTNKSGSISAEELRVCAQARMTNGPQKPPKPQTLTLTGNSELRIASLGAATGSPQAVAPARTLQDIRAGADKNYGVTLKVTSPQPLRIGTDFLEFEVVTNREGYLYIFQVGTKGDGTTLLFPNKLDGANKLPAGRYTFPRPSWALKSAGPAGTNHLMAQLSDEPKDYSEFQKRAATFANVPATRGLTKDFVAVSTGTAAGQKGRYGTSDVVQAAEVAP